ncbi:MAG: hypothetical protein GYA33_08735, partial [Thermogutta sp.]|nr:hypothetical protein [Thermogutta sp.]
MRRGFLSTWSGSLAASLVMLSVTLGGLPRWIPDSGTTVHAEEAATEAAADDTLPA